MFSFVWNLTLLCVEFDTGLKGIDYLVDWKGLKAVRIDPWPHPKLLLSDIIKENLN